MDDEELPEDRFHAKDVLSQQILEQRKKEREDKIKKSEKERLERHKKMGIETPPDDSFIMEETTFGPDGKEQTKLIDMRGDRDKAQAAAEAKKNEPTEEENAAALAAKAAADAWARETKQTVQLTSSNLAFELLD